MQVGRWGGGANHPSGGNCPPPLSQCSYVPGSFAGSAEKISVSAAHRAYWLIGTLYITEPSDSQQRYWCGQKYSSCSADSWGIDDDKPQQQNAMRVAPTCYTGAQQSTNYRMRQKQYPPMYFAVFLVSEESSYSHITVLAYFVLKLSALQWRHLVIYGVLKNFVAYKTHSWKSYAELAVKRLSGFHYQRNVAVKFTRIEAYGLLRVGKY